MIGRMQATMRGAAIAAAMIVAVVATAAAQDLAVRGETVYTMAGEPIQNGVVVIDDGDIARVGTAAEIELPEDVRVLSAEVITPGFIDARSTAGLTGIYNVPAVRDANEDTGPVQPALRAFDGFNPREPLLDYLLALGVTTVHTGPAPGNPVAGRSAIFKTAGELKGEMVLDKEAMMVFTLGQAPKQEYGSEGKAPTTRMKTAAMIREALLEAKQYMRAEDPEVDLGKEALAAVLRGEMKAMFIAHRADDIMTALRLTRRFDLNTVLAGASEAYLVREEIAETGVPVLVGPVMTRTHGETRNATLQNAALLHDVGIPLGIATGYEAYVPKVRVAPFEAAVAVAYGLPREAGLRALTIGAAKILGIADRVGSLEPGKDADLVLFDGDPFEYTTHVKHVIVDGEVVSNGEAWEVVTEQVP